MQKLFRLMMTFSSLLDQLGHLQGQLIAIMLGSWLGVEAYKMDDDGCK